MRVIMVFYAVTSGIDEDDKDYGKWCLFKEFEMAVVPNVGDSIDWGGPVQNQPIGGRVLSREFFMPTNTIFLEIDDGAYVIEDIDGDKNMDGWIKMTTEEYDAKMQLRS